MSRLGLTRLVTAGNRSSRFRLVGIVAGVAVGVGLFLLLFGASQGIGERSERSTWTQLISMDPEPLTAENAALSDDQMAAVSLVDHYQDRLITVVSVAATADSTVNIPGTEVVPAPGEYVASPAMTDLIEAVPPDRLGDRYGTLVGTIAPEALEGPDSLVVVRGATVDQLLGSATEPVIVTEFVGYDYSSQTYRTVAIIGAIAVLIPVLLLIAIVTDLGSAQRAERFAALRLIGATPRQLAAIAAVETAATTLLGAILGAGLYLLVVPLAARMEVGSSRFYPRDLLVSPVAAVIVIAATVIAATAVAWHRTRRADIGPLGASRERMERRPRIWSLLPLLAGTGMLMFAVWYSDTAANVLTVGMIVIGGFVFTTFGVLWAGPLLTSWVATGGSRLARNASQVIGFSRITRHPRAAFRAVAGLVVAVYTVTVFAVAVTAAAGVTTVTEDADHLPTSTLYAQLASAPTAEDAAAVRELVEVQGVTGTAIGHADQGQGIVLTADDATTLGLSPPEGAEYVALDIRALTDAPATIEPVAAPPPEALAPRFVFVTTDGEPASIERARTALTGTGLALTWYPITRADNAVTTAAAMENQFAAMAYTGILIAAALSTVSLAVSTLAALLNRQRVLGLLRLIGMPRPTLRNLITYETVLPIATVLILSIGLGALTAWCLITALTNRTVGWPDPSYYIILSLCGLLVAAAVTITVRAASAITANASTRYE